MLDFFNGGIDVGKKIFLPLKHIFIFSSLLAQTFEMSDGVFLPASDFFTNFIVKN